MAWDKTKPDGAAALNQGDNAIRDNNDWLESVLIELASFPGTVVSRGRPKIRTLTTAQRAVLADLDARNYILNSDTLSLDVYDGASWTSYRFLEAVLFSPLGNTAAAIQAEIDAANAAGGGVVFLGVGLYTLEAQITLKGNVCLMGCGHEATQLTLANNVDASAILMQPDSAIVGCRVSGNSANQTGTNLACIELATGSRFTIRDCMVDDSNQDGIYVPLTVTQLRISGCYSLNPGRNGIWIKDPSTATEDVVIDHYMFQGPGASDNDGSGIRLAGKGVVLNGVVGTLDRAAPNTQRGIWLETKLAAEPTDQSARGCVVSNFSIEGTGTNAVGLQIGGRDCSISNGYIRLTGSASFGITVDGVSSRLADHNTVMGVTVEGCACSLAVGATVAGNLASDNSFIGCAFLDHTVANGIQLEATRTLLLGCRIEGGVAPNVAFAAESVDERVESCTFKRGGTGAAWSVNSAAVGPVLSNNQIIGCDSAPSTLHSEMDGVAEVYYYNSTDSIIGTFNSGTPTDDARFAGLELPGPESNGACLYEITGALKNLTTLFGDTLNAVSCKVMVGPNGDGSDTRIYQVDNTDPEWVSTPPGESVAIPLNLDGANELPGGVGGNVSFIHADAFVDRRKLYYMAPANSGPMYLTIVWEQNTGGPASNFNVDGDADPDVASWIRVRRVRSPMKLPDRRVIV